MREASWVARLSLEAATADSSGRIMVRWESGVEKQKRPRGDARPEEEGETGVSTSYGGTIRVRFEGSFPRVGKSRLHDRRAPLSERNHPMPGSRCQESWRAVSAHKEILDSNHAFSKGPPPHGA
jgi:hypothetical protein